MKRNMDLIREILISVYDGRQLEKSKEIDYHIYLCKDAGFLDEQLNLKWPGIEFVSKFKDDAVWNRIFRILQEKDVPMSSFAIDMVYEKIILPEMG